MSSLPPDDDNDDREDSLNKDEKETADAGFSYDSGMNEERNVHRDANDDSDAVLDPDGNTIPLDSVEEWLDNLDRTADRLHTEAIEREERVFVALQTSIEREDYVAAAEERGENPKQAAAIWAEEQRRKAKEQAEQMLAEKQIREALEREQRLLAKEEEENKIEVQKCISDAMVIVLRRIEQLQEKNKTIFGRHKQDHEADPFLVMESRALTGLLEDMQDCVKEEPGTMKTAGFMLHSVVLALRNFQEQTFDFPASSWKKSLENFWNQLIAAFSGLGEYIKFHREKRHKVDSYDMAIDLEKEILAKPITHQLDMNRRRSVEERQQQQTDDRKISTDLKEGSDHHANPTPEPPRGTGSQP